MLSLKLSDEKPGLVGPLNQDMASLGVCYLSIGFLKRSRITKLLHPTQVSVFKDHIVYTSVYSFSFRKKT